MFVFKFRKKNYNVSKFPDILYLPIPYFFQQEKTDLFVALIILIDSLVTLDQLSPERFFTIFAHLEKSSHLFINNTLQYRLLIFFLFVSIQRPMNLIESIIKRSFSDQIMFHFYFFKQILANATINDFFKTTNENITIGNLELNQSIEQVFNSIYFIDNKPTSLSEFDSNLSQFFQKNFTNNIMLFIVNDFKKFILFQNRKKKELVSSFFKDFRPGIVIVTASNDKIIFLKLCLNDFLICLDFEKQSRDLTDAMNDFQNSFDQDTIQIQEINQFAANSNQHENTIEYLLFENFFQTLQTKTNKTFNLSEFYQIIMNSNLNNQDILMVLEILSLSTFLFQKNSLEKSIYIYSQFTNIATNNNNKFNIFDKNLISFYLLWYIQVYSYNQNAMINSWQLKNFYLNDMLHLINLSCLKSRFKHIFSNFENTAVCLTKTLERKMLVNFDTFNNVHVANNLFFFKSEQDIFEFDNKELEILEFDFDFDEIF